MTRKPKPPIALYSALADATRCRIIEILLAGPIPVHKLSDAFAISRPAISRHLRVLKTAGLVAEVKKGRENLYALRAAKLSGAMAWIETVVSPQAPESAAPPIAETTSAPLPAAAPKTIRIRRNTATVPEVAEALATPPAEIKPEKPVRLAKVEPPVNQMGFDF